MLQALYAAAGGAWAQQTRVDVLSGNVANLHTPGYRRQDVTFAEVLAGQVRAGARVTAVDRPAAQGPVVETGQPFDLAIVGPGFFRLQGPGGEVRYTRAGAFTLDPAGRLLGPGGMPLLGAAGPVTLPQGAVRVRVGDGGALLAGMPDGTWQPAGTLALAAFARPEALVPLGQGLWAAAPAAGPEQVLPAGDPQAGQVRAGALEQSGADLVQELAGLLAAQRLFAFNVRALQAADEMAAAAIRVRKG